MANGFTQFVTNTFDFQFGENFSRLQTRSDADVQQTSYITLAYFAHTLTGTHTHTLRHTRRLTLLGIRITHHMAETHAKSLLRQKVVKSERNQFSRRLSEKLLPLKLTRCV